MAQIRLSISIPDNILEKLDESANHMGLNRSAMLTVMITNYIEQRESLKAIKSINSLEELLKIAQSANK